MKWQRLDGRTAPNALRIHLLSICLARFRTCLATFLKLCAFPPVVFDHLILRSNPNIESIVRHALEYLYPSFQKTKRLESHLHESGDLLPNVSSLFDPTLEKLIMQAVIDICDSLSQKVMWWTDSCKQAVKMSGSHAEFRLSPKWKPWSGTIYWFRQWWVTQ